MPDDNDEIRNEIALKLKQLEDMRKSFSYEPEPLSDVTLFGLIAQKIPFLSRFLKKVNINEEQLESGGKVITTIGENLNVFDSSSMISDVASGFHFGTVSLVALDFVRIPVIYLGAFLLGQTVPVSLNNNAKLVYSGVLLGLAVTALVFPTTAPAIAFVGASLALTSSTFLLAKIFYDRYQLNKENKKIQRDLGLAEANMALIQLKAGDLHKRLSNVQTEKERLEIYSEMRSLKIQYQVQKEKIMDLKIKELHTRQQLDQLGLVSIMDKGVGITLGTITIIGLVVTLFNPPVGAWILAGAAITGSAYVAARIVIPLAYSLGKLLLEKLKPAAGVSKQNEQSQNDLAHVKNLDSTLTTLKNLGVTKDGAKERIELTKKQAETHDEPVIVKPVEKIQPEEKENVQPTLEDENKEDEGESKKNN